MHLNLVTMPSTVVLRMKMMSFSMLELFLMYEFTIYLLFLQSLIYFPTSHSSPPVLSKFLLFCPISVQLQILMVGRELSSLEVV